ncbi:hypothetical protein HK097_005198 [Rhizophlyctis rosea]|uniref:Uncharacterized protein n=1 Tax=Rhizophlyctis rosea TaxID=64517 RepID=A0AAD5SLI6_9FUNG|nr:hypothetical protein HK097_005198 [Rhizophlyctis rosea]
MAAVAATSFKQELRMFGSYLFGDDHHKKSPTAPLSSTIGAFVIDAVNVHLDLGTFDPLGSSTLSGTMEVILKQELVGVGQLEVELLEKIEVGGKVEDKAVEGSKTIAWQAEGHGPVVISSHKGTPSLSAGTHYIPFTLPWTIPAEAHTVSKSTITKRYTVITRLSRGTVACEPVFQRGQFIIELRPRDDTGSLPSYTAQTKMADGGKVKVTGAGQSNWGYSGFTAL